MANEKRYFTDESLSTLVDEVKAYTDGAVAGITSGTVVVKEAEYATSANTAGSATNATSATKATQDASGNIITSTYETKTDASAKLTEAKAYTDNHENNTDKHITSTERSNWNAAKNHADTAHAPSDAEKNQNAFSYVKVGTTSVAADTTTDTLTLAAGTNVTIEPDATNDSITISAIDTTYNEATQSAAGLLSAADKTQLDYGGIPIVTASSTDGATYTATVDGMSALTVGMTLIIVPNKASTTTSAKLNVNGLGAKTIRMPIAYNTSLTATGPVTGWLVANKPITVQWNGTYWVTSGFSRPSAQYLYGTVPVGSGGTGATDAANARTNLEVYSKTETDTAIVDAAPFYVTFTSDGSGGYVADKTYQEISAAHEANRLCIGINSESGYEGYPYYLCGIDGTEYEFVNMYLVSPTRPAGSPMQYVYMDVFAYTSSGLCRVERTMPFLEGAKFSGNVTLSADPTDALHAATKQYVDTKMNATNPTGTGSFSLNRKANTTIGTYSVAVGDGNTSTNTGSFAEGGYTRATADYAHAEGYDTAAISDYSHAEGITTVAGGKAAHAEGRCSAAMANYSHAEGNYAKAYGTGAHAEGNQVVAFGDYSHAEGNCTTANGIGAHAEGNQVVAFGDYSHAEGYGDSISIKISGSAYATTYTLSATPDTNLSIYKIIKFDNTVALITGYDSSALSITVDKTLSNTTLSAATATVFKHYASGNRSHAEGYNSVASGENSHAEGHTTIASGFNSHVEGYNTTASGETTHAEGNNTVASGKISHAEGDNTAALGYCSHAEGRETRTQGYYTHAQGYQTRAIRYCQCAMGQYNVEDIDGNNITYSTAIDALIIGNGTSDSTRSNAFRVVFDGKVYGGAYNSTGADYAEYFEWADGNLENEDRIGHFVTLTDGEHIKIASEGDEILGVVSGNGSIIGDSYDDVWQGMWMRDVYGRLLYEDVEVEQEDEDGNKTTVVEHRMKLNPNYNSEQEYIPRSQRPEWDAIGFMGKLIVIDDGTCQRNGYCTVGEGGIATASDSGYRVLARLDETHIKILIK